VGLIAAALESAGIRTVCLSTMEAIMEKVAPPRWLTLPYPLGFPLGKPLNPDVQRQIILQALRVVDRPGPGPVRVDFDPDSKG